MVKEGLKMKQKVRHAKREVCREDVVFVLCPSVDGSSQHRYSSHRRVNVSCKKKNPFDRVPPSPTVWLERCWGVAVHLCNKLQARVYSVVVWRKSFLFDFFWGGVPNEGCQYPKHDCIQNT